MENGLQCSGPAKGRRYKKRAEAEAITQVRNGKISGGQRPGKKNRKKYLEELRGVKPHGTWWPTGLEYEEEGRGIQADFQVSGSYPTGPHCHVTATKVCSLISRLNQNMGLETLINYPDATYTSSSLVKTIGPQDTLLWALWLFWMEPYSCPWTE